MKNRIWLLIVFAIIFSYIIYFFPVQRYFAETAFRNYILLQGASTDNIYYKKTYKDYKQDGYCIDVVYSDDLEYRYAYKYFVGKTPYKYNILCIVYDKQNVSVNVGAKKIKYPPIK